MRLSWRKLRDLLRRQPERPRLPELTRLLHGTFGLSFETVAKAFGPTGEQLTETTKIVECWANDQALDGEEEKHQQTLMRLLETAHILSPMGNSINGPTLTTVLSRALDEDYYPRYNLEPGMSLLDVIASDRHRLASSSIAMELFIERTVRASLDSAL